MSKEMRLTSAAVQALKVLTESPNGARISNVTQGGASPCVHARVAEWLARRGLALEKNIPDEFDGWRCFATVAGRSALTDAQTGDKGEEIR